MSANFESGFFVVQPPWHGLGVVLDDPPATAGEAITAGLNWEVTKEPKEAVVPVNGTYRAVGVHDQYAIIRRRIEQGITHLDSLGVVGWQYKPVQNLDAFRFFDRVVQSGMVTYNTAGSLRPLAAENRIRTPSYGAMVSTAFERSCPKKIRCYSTSSIRWIRSCLPPKWGLR